MAHWLLFTKWKTRAPAGNWTRVTRMGILHDAPTLLAQHTARLRALIMKLPAWKRCQKPTDNCYIIFAKHGCFRNTFFLFSLFVLMLKGRIRATKSGIIWWDWVSIFAPWTNRTLFNLNFSDWLDKKNATPYITCTNMDCKGWISCFFTFQSFWNDEGLSTGICQLSQWKSRHVPVCLG